MRIEEWLAKLRKQRKCKSFADVLRLLADYSKQRNDWLLVTHYLLLAAVEVEQASRRLAQSAEVEQGLPGLPANKKP